MNKAGVSFEEMKAEMLKDEEFKIEYDKLRPGYEAIEQIIKARKEQSITQSELAKRVGTKKSNISRFESGNCNPSLDFLAKVAESLGEKRGCCRGRALPSGWTSRSCLASWSRLRQKAMRPYCTGGGFRWPCALTR